MGNAYELARTGDEPPMIPKEFELLAMRAIKDPTKRYEFMEVLRNQLERELAKGPSFVDAHLAQCESHLKELELEQPREKKLRLLSYSAGPLLSIIANL